MENKNVIKIRDDFEFQEKMLRARDLAKIFVGLSPSTFDKWVKQGIITQYKIGGSAFYKLSEVELLIESSKVS